MSTRRFLSFKLHCLTRMKFGSLSIALTARRIRKGSQKGACEKCSMLWGLSRAFDAQVMREKSFAFSSFSGCREHTLAEEIKVGAAIHLAFHEFEFVDPPLDRPGTPWQGERRFDGGPVALDTFGKA